MKLAILVVYFFGPETRGLVDIHLDRLTRHTQVPHVIYGATALLSPEDRAYLAADGRVRLVETPPAPQHPVRRTGREHAHHLEALRALARAEGATHFATFHPDSFPISDRWFDAVLARFEAGDRFAVLAPSAFSGCMVWPRSFDDIGLPLDLDEHALAQDDWARFATAFPDTQQDTGTRFLLEAWRRGWSWHEMRQGHEAIWGEDIVHLVGTGRVLVGNEVPATLHAEFMPERVRRLRNGAQAILRRLPPAWRRSLFETLRPLVMHRIEVHDEAKVKPPQLQALLADPDGFLSAAAESDRSARTQMRRRDAAAAPAPGPES